MADRRIGFNLDFKANTKDVESNLNKLKKSLQDLQNIKFGDFKGSNDELRQIKRTASQVQGILERSFNTSLNATNIVEFRNQLDKTGLSMKDIQASFAQAGPIGQRAFGQLTSSILTTNLQLRETHSLIDSMGKTMMNTVKWGIASSVMNNFTQSVQGAFSYVQSLQKSLTNIRIVTGDSTQEMAKFADQANRSARELGRSTLDYTKSSLAFYQQGLDDETVRARTEATLKAQNITGTGAQMADYLTSVWNGYKVANEQAQLYVDKLAAVADSSASDMSQLAIAMSKVSATANVLGVDVDQLAASIATVVATTRLAPESVGTAFKTIFARINDIKTGSDQAEISLGNYSGKMASLGINVLDATGHLRDTGEVMDEIGQKWATMTREQQIYLAQTMGGQRQITQVTALFDNWALYSELLNTSLQSQGTLNEKNARYMESLGAKMEQLGAAGERVKAALIDEDTVKGGVQALTNLTNLTASFIESIGGGNNALLALGSIATQVFSGVISKEISSLITNFQNAKYNAEALNAEIALTKTIQASGQNSAGGQYVTKQMAEFQQYYSVLDEASINRQKNLIDERGQIENQIDTIRQARQAVSEVFKGIEKDDWALAGSSAKLDEINSKLGIIDSNAQTLKTSLNQTFKDNTFEIGDSFANFEKDFNIFCNNYEALDETKAEELRNAFDQLGKTITPAQFQNLLNTALDEAIQKSKEFGNTINQSENNLQKLVNTSKSLDASIEQNNNNAKQLFDTAQVVKLISSLGQVAVILNNISNLHRIIKDEDLSAGEKLKQIITNISFTLPLAVSAISNIIKSVNALTGANFILQQKAVAEERKIFALKTLQAAEENKVAAARLKTEKEITAQIAKRRFLEASAKDQKNRGGAYSFNPETNKLAEAWRNAKKEADAANVSFNKASDAVDDALDGVNKSSKAFSDFGSNASIAMDSLKAGTSQLLSNLGAIAPYAITIGLIVGGIYALYKSFNYAADQAKKAAQETEKLKQKYDDVKNALKDLKSEISQYDQAQKGLDQLVKGTEEWYDKIKDLNSQVSELIEKFPTLAKYIQGIDSNGLIQLEQGWEDALKQEYQRQQLASGLSYLQQRQRSDQATAQSQIVNKGREIYGLYGDRLPQVLKLLEENNGTLNRQILEGLHWNEDQIEVTLNNLKDIQDLKEALEQNKNETKALTDATIKATLVGKEGFTGSKYSDAIADAYVYGIKQAESQPLGDEYYTTDIFGTRQLNKAKVVSDFNAAFGQSYSVGLLGNIKNSQGKTVTASEVTEALQNYKTAENSDQIYQDALERIENISKNYSEEVTKALLNNGFAGGRDNIRLNQLSQAELDNIDINALAELWGVKPEQIAGVIEQIGTEVNNGLQDFIGDLDVTSQAILTRLRKNGGLTEQVTHFIAEDLNNVENNLGPEAKGFVGNFFEKVFNADNLETGSNFISTFDFASGSLEDFTKGLEEAGIATQEATEQIKQYYEIQRESLKIESKNLRVNPTNVAQGSQTASIFQKAANGESLSKEDLENMEDGVSNLLKMYPELTKDVKILSDTQLTGTSMYAESLRKLKMTLYDSYQAMSLSEAGFDADVLYSQISSLIVASEDLQAANIRGLLTEENFSSKLIELGSNYQNCKEDVEKYSAALRNHQDAIKETLNLEIALIAAEQSALYNLDPSTVEALAKSYSDAWAAQDGFNDNIYQNAELANDAAVAYLRLNEGIASLQSSYDDVAETLNVLANYDLSEILADEDLRKNFDLIQESVAGILNTSKDLVGEDFIKEYSKQILDAANGSEDAVKELMQAWGQQATENLPELPPIQLNLDNDEALQTLTFTKDQIQNFLNNLPQGQLSIDNLNAINNMIAAMQLAGMTAQEIQRYFEDKQIDLDIGPASEAMQELLAQSADTGPAFAENISTDVQTNTETFSDTDEKQNVGMRGHWEPVYGWNVLPTVSAEMAGPLGGINYSPGNPLLLRVQGQQWVAQSPQVQTAEATNTTTATAIQAKAGNVRKGGTISHKNKSGGNRKHSGSGGKGGGGSKGSQPKTPKKAAGVTAKTDPYRTVNNALKRTGSQLEKVSKEQEKLAGKDLIDNLTKQQKILDEQVELYKEKLAIAKQERDTIASTLQQQGIGLQFDQNGTISNMEQALEQAAAKANAEIARYNRMSAEEQQQDANKNIAKNAETWFKNIQTLLSNYDKLTEDTIPDLEKTIADQLAKQLELNLEKFNLQIDLTLDAGQASRQYNEFKKQVIDKIADDDILDIDRYLQEDIKLYQAENQALDKHIEEIRERISNMQNGLFDSVYGNNINQAFEDLAKYTDKAVDNLKDIEDKIKDIRESVFDAIDKVEQAFDEQKEEYDYISDLIDHSRKLTEIRYGDDAYDLMEQLYERERENNNSLLEFQYGQTQLWYQKMLEARQNMNNATDEQDRKHWEKQFKEYEKLYIDSQNELNSKFEESIENIIDKYVNAINKVFDELEKRMTNGLGLGYLADEWDLINEGTDRYLDKVDALYEIDTLDNAYQEAIKNAEGNPQAQKSLNELMNTQLKYLRDKDKLTKYDVDRANALLDIEVKRLALENSRNNKSKLRLRRDSQGNYTYQYTADDSDVNKAEQDLAKARKDLYDMTRDSYKDNLEDFQSTLTQMENDIKDVMADATLSEEQRWKKAKMLAQNYAPQIKDILSNLEVTKGFLPNDMVDSLSASLHEAIQLSDDDAETLLHTIVPQMTSTLADAAKYVRDQGIEGLVNDMFEGYNLASEQLRKEMEQAEHYVNQDLSELIKQTDAAILVAKDLLENNARLIADNQDFINRVNQQIAQGVQEAMAATNTSLADTTLSALDAATAFDRLNASLQAAIMTLDPDYYNINTNKASSRDVNNVNKSVYDTLNSGMEIASGATGMYTGTWGSEGRLAILHEKELLLNKDDTKNMLSAINIVRAMDDLLNNIDFNNKILNSSIAIGSGTNQSSAVDQKIHIEANFPNVSMRGEIEKAFEGLVNQAYQYAFNTKK